MPSFVLSCVSGEDPDSQSPHSWASVPCLQLADKILAHSGTSTFALSVFEVPFAGRLKEWGLHPREPGWLLLMDDP